MAGSLEVGGGENVPGIPGACATRNFMYLVRGPCIAGGINPGTRAGVFIFRTRTRSSRVLDFWYPYSTRTREFQSNSTHTCSRTRGQVLQYSHKYWLNTDILWCISDIRMKTIPPVKWIVCLSINETFHFDLFCYDLNIWYMGCDWKFHNFFKFYHHRKVNWINMMTFMFIIVIRPSPFSHSTSG